MSKLRMNAAAAAFALGFALAAPVALAAPNLVYNGDFSLLPSPTDYENPLGWTKALQPPTRAGTLGFHTSGPDNNAPDNALGIFSYGYFACQNACYAGQSSSISQLISGLVQNENYQLTFYTYGFSYYETSSGATVLPPPTMSVSLGTQTTGPVTIPGWDGRTYPYPWKKETFNFTQLDASGSALLRITQSYSAFPSCLPCMDILYFTNFSLTDVGPGPVPPGPGPVSEPSGMATVALGLGALGLFYRRRSHGSATPRSSFGTRLQT